MVDTLIVTDDRAVLRLAGVPFPLDAPRAEGWRAGPDDDVTVTAGRDTDLFLDPATEYEKLNAPRLLGVAADGDYQFSARVSVEFRSTYDAGTLLVWADERHWAKLCFEFSPDREPMVVSVVTRGLSDDANAFVVDGHTVWLRVSRRGRSYAFHASTDGRLWKLIRSFSIGDDLVRARVGLEAQSPTGTGLTARFDKFKFRPETLSDLRNGD
jgi:regulation of enolase protein 1 (concanavalin A-like superfamily)